ncbi:hypothetical protein EDD22DRAFT_843485 [Suillus occidentalis]|nr:hypothetical protein EDD22DRAFT_843485 [Suillus occidentalis]
MRFAFVTALAVVTALTSSISATPAEPAEIAAAGECPSFCTRKSDCHHVGCPFKACVLLICFFMALTHEPLVNLENVHEEKSVDLQLFVYWSNELLSLQREHVLS